MQDDMHQVKDYVKQSEGIVMNAELKVHTEGKVDVMIEHTLVPLDTLLAENIDVTDEHIQVPLDTLLAEIIDVTDEHTQVLQDTSLAEIIDVMDEHIQVLQDTSTAENQDVMNMLEVITHQHIQNAESAVKGNVQESMETSAHTLSRPKFQESDSSSMEVTLVES